MIEFLRTFFLANRIIILFIYGQVFFVLGLAIALQSWRHTNTIPWINAHNSRPVRDMIQNPPSSLDLVGGMCFNLQGDYQP